MPNLNNAFKRRLVANGKFIQPRDARVPEIGPDPHGDACADGRLFEHKARVDFRVEFGVQTRANLLFNLPRNLLLQGGDRTVAPRRVDGRTRDEMVDRVLQLGAHRRPHLGLDFPRNILHHRFGVSAKPHGVRIGQ